MTTDHVRNRTFHEVLRHPVCFEIPFFQRGYAWEKKEWDQLFQDVQEQLLDELAQDSSILELEYFFGPIVVLERTGSEFKRYFVVDGQQRITTIYLLLGIIRNQLRSRTHQSAQAADYYTKLAAYLENDIDDGDDYSRLKVFSSKGDRLPTYRTIFGSESNPISPSFATDVQLYNPGTNRVDEFSKYAIKKLKSSFRDAESLWQLSQVLLRCLKVVWIPLDDRKDDPQAIFESLNDKGRPLRASELLCNYLFKPLSEDAKEEFESLHNDKWLGTIRQLNDNEQFEEYLRCLFSIGEAKTIGKHRKVYVHFKNRHRHLDVATAKRKLAEISDGVKSYTNIADPERTPHHNVDIRNTLTRIQQTRMDSSTPFVLSVLIALREGRITSELARLLLTQLEVLLVRRKMTEQPTTVYDTMFPPLLEHIAHEPSPIRALHEQFRKHSVWVSDAEFKDALVHRTLYRTRDLAFARLVLSEIDKKLQRHGQLPDYGTVGSIEHALPQSLDEEWIRYLGEDAHDERLTTVLHTVGNLCLLSAPANSSVGNNPFSAKVESYSSLTRLGQFFKEFQGKWNIKAIEDRSRALADVAVETWKWSAG